MTIFRHSVLVAALFVLAVHSPGWSGPTAGQFQDFTLTLAAPKARYFELQPIPLVITLKNETDAPLVGHSALGFSHGYLRLYVTGGDGRHKIEELSLAKALVEAQPHKFMPGEEVKKTESLHLKLNEIFPKPGTYQLTAQLDSGNGKGSVSSQPIEVEIVDPVGLDEQALQFIRAHDEPAYFFTGALVLQKPEKLQSLENFVAMYGESAYGNDASFLLGQVQVAKREYQKARTLFEQLSKKSDFAFAGQASEYLKRIEREEKKKRP